MRKFINIESKFSVVLIFTVLLTFCVSYSHAQQDPVYSQYMNNLMSVNPAYTGVRGVGSISNINRAQWVNLENAPMTSSLTFHMPIDSIKVGAGIDFTYDNHWPATTTALFFNYAYSIEASSNSRLSFGLKGGFNYLRATLTQLDRYHEDDQYIIDYGDFSRFMSNFGVGLFWYSNNAYAGFAVPRLLQNKYHRDVTIVEAASREERHYMVHGAYMHRISPNLVFKPGVSAILTAGAPVTADFDFGFLFYNRFAVGSRYRISDSVGGYVHMQIENFKVGFLYEYPLTDIRYFNIGTMELMLRFDFKTRGNQVFPDFSF